MERRTAIVSRTLFREPDGRRKGLLFAGLALLQVLAWVYLAFVIADPNEWPGPQLLVTVPAFVTIAVAESLPASRRRLVGALRVVAVSIPVAVLVHLAVAPEFYL